MFMQLIRQIAATAPDFGLAALVAVTWWQPLLWRERMVADLLAVMLMELLVVHSAGFMGVEALQKRSAWVRMRNFAALATGYSLFALGFVLSLEAWWPMLAFWALLGSRVLNLWSAHAFSAGQKQIIQAQWAAGVAFYVIAVFATVFLPLPRLGITPSVVALQDFSVGGLWPDQSHRVMAMGLLYFFALGLFNWRAAAKWRYVITSDSGIP